MIQRRDNLCTGTDPLIYFIAPASRHQRRYLLNIKVKQPWSPESLDLQHVSCTAGRQQGRAGTLSFDNGVGGYGRPEQDAVKTGGRKAVLVAEALKPRENGSGGRIRSRGHLEGQKIFTFP